ncbi:Exportin-6 [Mortierella sp. AM989]|nr:Exportin-6 [Mortierella sp. AM989]
MDALEQLLAEFFGPATTTERKRSIEAQLEGQRLTLDDCRYMLTNAQSDYLAWFAASQYQKRIQAEWSNLDPELQHVNRSFLIQFLQQHFGMGSGSGSGSALVTDISAELRMEPTTGGAIGTASSSGISGSNVHFSPFVLNKVVQLVTDIALLDWPARFQDLFPEIHKMIQSKNKNHSLLGWTLLEAIVQEFVGTYPAPGSGKSNRVHLTLSQQKRYLWEHFKAETSDLLALIVQHLDACYSKMLVTPLSTEAPAPSPVEHSVWGNSYFARRPSTTASHLNSMMQTNNSLQNSLSASKAVPGSSSSSLAGMNHQGDHSPSQSFGKSPTTMLRKSLGQFLGGPTGSSTLNNDSGSHVNLTHSPAGPGLSLLQARHRMGSISDLGQMAMRRNSINAAVMMESRRNSMDNSFISGNRMDSHSRKTCMLGLQALTALLACPGLDPRQVSFSPSITIVLKFTTLHQNKTVDLGILALSCLNGLVARPGFLATNQDAMTGAVRIMADLIRYFNEVKDGIDDIDESYLQMFMHFVSLFCTLVNLERAEKTLGLSKPEFLVSFARFTIEKVSVDYLKTCMDVWKGLLEAIIHAASEIPRPIPPQHALRRIQGPLLYFMSALVEKFYKMKGVARSEDAFSTFEVEDEEDLEDLTDLVESFVGLVAEVFTEEVIEMLNPLLSQQLELYSRREIDECKTLPVTLGILSRVAYNFDQNFEDRREYTSNLIIHLMRMTKLSIDYYLATAGDTASPGKDDVDLIGTVTLSLFGCLQPLISWLNHLWKVETDPGSNASPRTPIAREIYRELSQLSSLFFQRLLPSSPQGSIAQQSTTPTNTVNTFLGPVSTSCSVTDRRLLLISIKTLEMLTVQVRIPTSLLSTGEFLFWELESIHELASCLCQIFVRNCTIMGLQFTSPRLGHPSEEDEREKTGISPDDELFLMAYSALSNGITLDPKANRELQAAASQAFGSLVAPIIYQLQGALHESISAPGSFLSNGDVKFRIHRCLTILRALIDSVSEASAASRAMVHEGLNSAFPLVQELFEVYREDHDILLFFKALVKGLYRQVGINHCIEIARALMDRFTNPSMLEAVLSMQHNGHSGDNGHQYQQQQTLHQQSIRRQQQKALQRIHITISILKTILELPGKEISLALGDFMQFLFSQLGPRLLGVQNQQTTANVSGGSSPLPSHQQQHQRSQEENGHDDGVYDLMTLFFSTIKTLLTHHTRSFFTSGVAAVVASPSNGQDNNNNNQRVQMLQSCMESFARGLHRPEPEIVRQSIDILMSLQEHSLCHLFERAEFQTTYRSEFLKILLRMALSHQQDLLLEEIAGLAHKMVIAKASGSDITAWDDLKKFVLDLEPSQALVTVTPLSSTVANGHSPAGAASPHTPPQALGGSSPHTPLFQQQLQQVGFPVAAKEALWNDLKNLGDESLYREGLYEFVNDAQVYAQNLLT